MYCLPEHIRAHSWQRQWEYADRCSYRWGVLRCHPFMYMICQWLKKYDFCGHLPHTSPHRLHRQRKALRPWQETNENLAPWRRCTALVSPREGWPPTVQRTMLHLGMSAPSRTPMPLFHRISLCLFPKCTGWTNKMVILVDMAITTLKSIRKVRSWCVLENSD